MDKGSLTLWVFFEEPFWVGYIERVSAGELFVSKTVFGAEPKDGEIYTWIVNAYDRLHFSPGVKVPASRAPANFKKRERAARRQTGAAGIGTHSQQALALQREQMKTRRRAVSRAERQRRDQLRFEHRQQKKKDKHRGR